MNSALPPFHKHTSHLNRIIGQVEGVKKMLEARRYCIDILTQLRAARQAIKSIEGIILDTHLTHCVTEVLENPHNKVAVEQKIAEIQRLLKTF